MVPRSAGGRSSLPDLGPPLSGPLCDEQKQQASAVLLASPGGGLSGGGLWPQLGSLGDLRISPSPPDPQSSVQGLPGVSVHDTHCHSLAQETLVSAAITAVVRQPQETAPVPLAPLPTLSPVRGAIEHGHHHPMVSGLEAERGLLQDQGLSVQVVNIMLFSRRASTCRVYDSCRAAFHSWCSAGDIHSTASPIFKVIHFLTSLVADSKSVNTIRGYVSAISLRHDQDEGRLISVTFSWSFELKASNASWASHTCSSHLGTWRWFSRPSKNGLLILYGSLGRRCFSGGSFFTPGPVSFMLRFPVYPLQCG